MKDEKIIGTVARAAAVLRVIAEAGQPLSVSTAAERLGLPASTSHRLLTLMADLDLVEYRRDTRRYGVGVEYLRLAGLVMSHRSIVQVAEPFLRHVADNTGESCLLGLYRPRTADMTFVAQVQSQHSLQFSVAMNQPMPLLWGCSGRVILAHLAPEEIERVIDTSGPSPATGAPPPPLESIQQVLEGIRARGSDSTWGEKLPHSVGIAAPIFSAGNRVIGSLSITIPEDRFDSRQREAHSELLTRSAANLSVVVGGLLSAEDAQG